MNQLSQLDITGEPEGHQLVACLVVDSQRRARRRDSANVSECLTQLIWITVRFARAVEPRATRHRPLTKHDVGLRRGLSPLTERRIDSHEQTDGDQSHSQPPLRRT